MPYNQPNYPPQGYQQPEPEMGWDDVISNDGNEFETVPEGDYYFTVTAFKRARHEGSEKMPPCNKAVLMLALTSAWEPTDDNPAVQGETTVNLFLNRKNEWKLCQFFTAIGQRKHGEEIRMNWNAVPNSTGTCAVSLREWTGNDGRKYTGNDVKRFYDPEKSPVQSGQPSASSYQRGCQPQTPPSSSQHSQTRIPGTSPAPATPWSSGKF